MGQSVGHTSSCENRRSTSHPARECRVSWPAGDMVHPITFTDTPPANNKTEMRIIGHEIYAVPFLFFAISHLSTFSATFTSSLISALAQPHPPLLNLLPNKAKYPNWENANLQSSFHFGAHSIRGKTQTAREKDRKKSEYLLLEQNCRILGMASFLSFSSCPTWYEPFCRQKIRRGRGTGWADELKQGITTNTHQPWERIYSIRPLHLLFHHCSSRGFVQLCKFQVLFCSSKYYNGNQFTENYMVQLWPCRTWEHFHSMYEPIAVVAVWLCVCPICKSDLHVGRRLLN